MKPTHHKPIISLILLIEGPRCWPGLDLRCSVWENVPLSSFHHGQALQEVGRFPRQWILTLGSLLGAPHCCPNWCVFKIHLEDALLSFLLQRLLLSLQRLSHGVNSPSSLVNFQGKEKQGKLQGIIHSLHLAFVAQLMVNVPLEYFFGHYQQKKMFTLLSPVAKTCVNLYHDP